MARGHIKLRRGLGDHIKDGKLTPLELWVYIHLLFSADFETGKLISSAISIYYRTGRKSSMRNLQRALESLEEAGYIKRFMVKGAKGDYPILIHKYEVTFGALTGRRLNASETTNPDFPIYFDRVDDDVDRDADDDVDVDVTSGATFGGYIRSSDKNSEKELSKNSQKNSKTTRATAVADAAAVAPCIEIPHTPITEQEAVDLEYIHYCANPLRPAMDDPSREENQELLRGFHIPDPVRFANILFWAYRKSTTYGPLLNGLNSFLKLFPKIEKSYESYFDQPEYFDKKLTQEDKLNTIEKVSNFVEKIAIKELRDRAETVQVKDIEEDPL